MKLEWLTWGLLALSALAGPLLVDPLATEPLGPVKGIASLLLPMMALVSALADRGAGIWQGPFQKSLGSLMAVAVVCALRSPAWPLASEELLRLSGLMATALAASSCRWTPRRVLWFCGIIVMGAFINGALALAEHYNLPWKIYGQQDRLVALFGHQNVLAQFLVIPTMMLMAWPGSPIISRILSTLMMGLLGLTLCRGAWAAVLGGVLTLSIIGSGRGPFMLKRFLWPLIGGVALGLVVNAWAAPSPTSGAPFTYKRDTRILTGDSNRLNYYSQGTALLLERPFLGWGLGQFPAVYQKIDSARNEYVRYLHCDYLQWGIETGFVGLASLLIMGWIMLGLLRRSPDHLTPMGAALVGTLAHSLVEYNMQMSVTSTLAALCAGAIASTNTVEISRPPSRWVWALAGLGGLLLLLPVIVAPMQSSRLEKDAMDAAKTDPSLSMAILDKALEKTPHDPTLLWNCAWAQGEAGLDQQAVETLERLRVLTPWNERVHLLLADLHERMGNVQAMAVSLERAREVLPRSRALLVALALLYSRQGMAEERDSALGTLRTMNDWNENWKEFISRLDSTNNPSSLFHIVTFLKGLAEKGENHPRIMMKLASVHFRLQQFDQALILYRDLMSQEATLKANLDIVEREGLFIAAVNTARQTGQETEAQHWVASGLASFPMSRPLFTLSFQQQLDQGGLLDALKLLNEALRHGANEIVFRRLTADILEKWSQGPRIEQEVERQRQLADYLETSRSR
ncbi:MAG: O-antigen ligase family protein [Planctomycetota bacterium]